MQKRETENKMNSVSYAFKLLFYCLWFCFIDGYLDINLQKVCALLILNFGKTELIMNCTLFIYSSSTTLDYGVFKLNNLKLLMTILIKWIKR